MDVVNLNVVVGDKRKEEVITTLQEALAQVGADGAIDVLILLKSNGRFIRFSPPMQDVSDVIAQLEVLKYDILCRMYE